MKTIVYKVRGIDKQELFKAMDAFGYRLLSKTVILTKKPTLATTLAEFTFIKD